MFWRDKYKLNTRPSQFFLLSKTSKNAPYDNWNKMMTKNLSDFFIFRRRVSNHLSSFIQILKPLSFIAENRAGNFVWLPSCGINYQIILFFLYVADDVTTKHNRE